jgi:hypothetical protein
LRNLVVGYRADGSGYSVLRLKDDENVEIVTTGFETEAEAQEYIAAHKN